MSDLSIGAASRNAVLSLQETGALMMRTQNRLSTGLKVASAVDDSVAFYKAKALSDRASDFSSRKLEIDQGISSMKSGINGGSLADIILKQMKGIINSVRTADSSTRTALSAQFTDLTKQINSAVMDGSYQGLNLINNSSASMTVYFSQGTSASVTIKATNLMASKLMTTMGVGTSAGGLVALGNMLQAAGAAVGGFSTLTSQTSLSPAAVLDSVASIIDRGISRIRSQSSLLGGNVTFLQTRIDFTSEYSSTLNDGSGKLTLADLNQEGANMVSLQARQQIGIQALSIAGQQKSAILSLLH